MEHTFEKEVIEEIESIMGRKYRVVKNHIIKNDAGQDLMDIDVYLYKDFVDGNKFFTRVILCFQIARVSKNWVRLEPSDELFEHTPQYILCGYNEEEGIDFVDVSKLPYAEQDVGYTKCKFMVKDRLSGEFKEKKDYVDDEIRKCAISSLYLCYKTINEVKTKFEKITVFVNPIVVNQDTTIAGGFEYYLSKKDLSYEFIRKINHPNIEPISIKIVNRSVLKEILKISDMFTKWIDECFKIKI